MSQKFTKELVHKYALDLLISLTEEENQMVLEEFDIIEENMEKINAIADLKEEEAMTHPFPLENVLLRDDVVEEELPLEDVLLNAKNKTMEEVIVSKVVE